MSDRYSSYNKGSSRSTRDDSRLNAKDDSRRRRSRSRSPRSHISPASSHYRKYSPKRDERRERSYSDQDHKRDKSNDDKRKVSNDWESDEEVPAPPPPPRITKVSIDFSKPKAPIKMNLGATKTNLASSKPTVASVFSADDDDDDEPEEMPAEAKMRMRNIGRETPTSAGPNSFGKTKQGFCDSKKVFEKNLKQALDTVEKPSIAKLPQTIYRIKGP